MRTACLERKQERERERARQEILREQREKPVGGCVGCYRNGELPLKYRFTLIVIPPWNYYIITPPTCAIRLTVTVKRARQFCH